MHVQDHGPVPEKALGVPFVHKLPSVAERVVKLWPLSGPQEARRQDVGG
jgi:hypothetical protein